MVHNVLSSHERLKCARMSQRPQVSLEIQGRPVVAGLPIKPPVVAARSLKSANGAPYTSLGRKAQVDNHHKTEG